MSKGKHDALAGLEALLAERKATRDAGAQAYRDHDEDLCMLCHAHGEDKRSLRIECFYAVDEVVPEALDLSLVEGEGGYYLRICKSCRGALLDRLAEWREERVALRSALKDHDGYLLDESRAEIPLRQNGRIVYVTRQEYAAWQRALAKARGES